MRLLAFLEYCAILVGVIAIAAGRYYALSKGVHLGVFLIGAGVALGGIESIATRRMGFRFTSTRSDAWAGAPALIVGWMALAAGALIIVSAYLMDQGLWHKSVGYLMRRPGALLAGGGLFAIGVGALLMMNPRGRRGVWWTLLVRVPKWTAGLVLVLGGIAGIGLGIWEWYDPRAYARFANEAQKWLDPRALARWWNGLTAIFR
jgi:hypothetical protein